MTLPAEGPISEVEEILRRMLADSGEVQTFLGVTDAEAASAKIHIDALPVADNGEQYTPDEAEALRPYVLIGTNRDGGYTIAVDSMSRSLDFRESGSITAQFVRSIHADDLENPRNADRRFKNQLGRILRDVANYSALDDYFAFQQARLTGPDQRHPDREHDEGPYQFANIEFIWGQDA